MATMEQQVESIVDTILEDYRNGRSIDRMNPFCLLYTSPSPRDRG